MSGCDQGIGRSRYTVTIIISRSRGILFRRIKRCICLSTPPLNDIKFLNLLSIYSLLLFREFNFRQRSLHYSRTLFAPFFYLFPPPPPLHVFRSLFPFKGIHYVHLCRWLRINGPTLAGSNDDVGASPRTNYLSGKFFDPCPPESICEYARKRKEGEKKKKEKARLTPSIFS